MAISVSKPTVGGSESTWGATINTGLDTLVDALNGTSGTVAPDLSTLTINGTDVTATAAEINTASSHYVPTGGIILWSGAVNAIPTGWLLCNGSNSTPDLRDRFVVGAGSTYAVDDTGGADTVTLSEADMPAHTHSSGSLGGTTNTTGAHTHTYNEPFNNGTAFSGSLSRHSIRTANTSSAGDHSHTVDVNSGSTGSTGSGTAHENRPPYYALAYIMKA